MSEDYDEASKRIKRKGPGRPRLDIDLKCRVQRCRKNAKDCRTRKKIRYQYLEDLVRTKERAIFKLRKEMDQVSPVYIIFKIISLNIK